jgi:hypothetical protein
MSENGPKTCFISAPFGFDSSALAQALAEDGIESSRLDKLEPGDDVVSSVRQEIKKADLVCVALPAGFNLESVVFEAGVALGVGRPLLILAEPEVDVPFELQHLLYVRAALGDSRGLSDLLKTYIPRIPRRVPVKRRTQQPAPRPLDRSETDRLLALLRGPGTLAQKQAEVVNFLAIAFQKVGVGVSGSTASDRGADLAIWVDETQSIFGNPVLVEVKLGRLNQSLIDETCHTLRNYLVSSNLLLGVIVYWDPKGTKYKVTTTSLPLVICLSVDELVDSLRLGRFANTLLEIRNRAVHGATA